MEAIQKFAASVNASFSKIGTAVDGVVADVAGLKDLITKLQNSPGALTTEDQATLDAADAQLSSVATKLTALDEATAPVEVPVPPVA